MDQPYILQLSPTSYAFHPLSTSPFLYPTPMSLTSSSFEREAGKVL